MTRFYLTGQRTFGNRGCEAIVRSTVALLEQRFGDVTVLVPSNDIERDSAQWPEAGEHGVEFVRDYMPPHTRPWAHCQRLPIAVLKQAGWPFPMPAWLRTQLSSVDAVLAIGGDNYSLDYRLPSLWMGIDNMAIRLGKPVMIWGASVGPFDREPDFVPAIIQHLAAIDTICVRETASYRYLTEQFGLTNVLQMADPAFTLSKQKIDTTPFWPENVGQGVLGINISPLIERYKKTGQNLRTETAEFIRHAVRERDLSVLLIPHVTPLDGSTKNSDALYMNGLISELADLGNRVSIMPHALNAAQIKYVIGDLRFFIGARTHATIAALSSGIPTISIAYSIKAKGINHDLFGNDEAVLPTPDLSKASLCNALQWLIDNENQLKQTLAERIPQLQHAAKAAVDRLADILHD